jgi:hypothetical protein
VNPSHLSYRIIFPRQFRLNLYHGIVFSQRKIITDTVCLDSGVSDLSWVCDENGDIMCDEDENVIIDSEQTVTANVKVAVYFIANDSSGYIRSGTTAQLLDSYNTVEALYWAVSDVTVMTEGAYGVAKYSSTFNHVSQTFNIQSLIEQIQAFLNMYDVYEADFQNPIGVFYGNSKITAGSLSGTSLVLSDLIEASENEIAVLFADPLT